MPSVAVIIPTKNEAQYLPRLLGALAAQTRKPDEVIVADAGSTDGTREIATAYGARVVVGGNAAEGRNAGAAASSAEYLLFFDADAIIDVHCIARALDEFVRRSLGVATADIIIDGGDCGDRTMFALYNRYVRLWGNAHPHLIGTCILVRRTLHEAVHGFDASVTFAEDHDYGLRIKRAGGKFGVLNDVRIATPPRRRARIGRMRFLMVNLLAEPYILFLGPIRSQRFLRWYTHGQGE